MRWLDVLTGEGRPRSFTNAQKAQLLAETLRHRGFGGECGRDDGEHPNVILQKVRPAQDGSRLARRH